MIHDLTHRLVMGMPVFPGDPQVRIEPWAEAAPWRVSALRLGSHSGTHVDAPRHYLVDGRGIGDYPPERFIGPGLVLDATGRAENEPLGTEILEAHRGAIRAGSFVVLRTAWDGSWGQERYFRHPYVGDELATALVGLRAGLVAIDALNVDSTADGGSAAHERLLAADVLIVENLRGLDALEAGRPYVFAFVPLALGDLDGAPVRALAWEMDGPIGDLDPKRWQP
jgi:kynurenine formamidase